MLTTGLIIVGGLGAACAAHHLVLTYRIRRHEKALRRQGLPLSLNELGKWSSPDGEGEDAAALYCRAFELSHEIRNAERKEEMERDMLALTESSPPDDFELPDEALSLEELLRELNRVRPERLEEDSVPVVDDFEFLARREPLAGEAMSRAKRTLERRREVLALFHEAAKIRQCRYEVNWDDFVNPPEVPLAPPPTLETLHDAIPEDRDDIDGVGYPGDLLGLFERGSFMDIIHTVAGGRVRSGVSLLCLEAIMRAATGRSDEVAVPIQDAVRLARSLDCLSTLITHCVLTHCTDTILDTVEYLLDVYDVPADTAAALVDAIGPLKDPDALFRTCVGELCFVITDWSSDLFCSERWREHMQRWMWCAFGFEKLYCLHFLIARAKQAALARLPRQERITAAKRAEERMRRGIPYPWLPLLFSSNWFEGEESRLKQCDQLETRLRAYAAG